VTRQVHSGLSVQAFCQREGINAWSLYGWRSRLHARGASEEPAVSGSARGHGPRARKLSATSWAGRMPRFASQAPVLRSGQSVRALRAAYWCVFFGDLIVSTNLAGPAEGAVGRFDFVFDDIRVVPDRGDRGT
jgi:hypothetical protein